MSSTPHYLASTLALCLCTLTHAYLLISVFPYSGYMAIDLLPNRANEENAGTYAGLLASSFMIGRALSSYAWGKWADVYGRQLILVVSLALSAIFSILFGMSQTFLGAIISTTCVPLFVAVFVLLHLSLLWSSSLLYLAWWLSFCFWLPCVCVYLFLTLSWSLSLSLLCRVPSS